MPSMAVSDPMHRDDEGAPRRAGTWVACLVVLSAAAELCGCAVEPQVGTFAVDPVGIVSPLQSACADGEAAAPFHVTVSDIDASTYVAEPDAGRIWVRGPFGIVADRCYWVSVDSDRPGWPDDGSRPECFVDDLLQDGTCSGEADAPDGWLFLHGGFIDVPGLRGRLAVHERLAYAWAGSDTNYLRVVDLLPDDDGCPEGQAARTVHQVLYSLDVPAGYNGFTEGDLAVDGQGRFLLSLSPVDDQLGIWDLPLSCTHGSAMAAPRVRVDLPCTPDGPLAVDPDGDRVFALCASQAALVTVSDLGAAEPQVSKRSISAARGGMSLAYEPVSDTVWIAAPEAGDGKVVQVPASGGAVTTYDVPGASAVAVGETRVGDERTGRVYAIGGGRTALYRFDPLTREALVQDLGQWLWGLDVGREMQEIAVVVQDEDGRMALRSFVDRDHLDAQAAGALKLMVATFLEVPRDTQLDDATAIDAELAAENHYCADLDQVTAGWPPFDRSMYQVCCVQRARADQLEANLDYVDRLVDATGAAGEVPVLLGVNPTVLLQSAHCIQAGLELGHEELADLGLPLLQVVGERVRALDERGDAWTTLLIHTEAGSEDQVPYTCPELWRPDLVDPDCDVAVEDLDAYEGFLGDLLMTTSLARVAEDHQGTGSCGAGELPIGGGCVDLAALAPSPRAFVGGFDKTAGLYRQHGDINWVDAFAAVHPGDGAPFTYFAGGGAYPAAGHAEAKEPVPWDARLRLAPFAANPDLDQWDRALDDGELIYLPGSAVSQQWLYEGARSGLFTVDMVWHAVDAAWSWSDEQWPGEESMNVLDVADFAVLTHDIVYHHLAARQADMQRVEYLHLPDLCSISLDRYVDGRVACTDQADCANRDAMQDWIRDVIPTLGAGVEWGIPGELR